MSPLEAYRALADESRLRLISILSRGQFNVQELTGIVNLSQPTVSHHLKVLQNSGLVKVRREGTWAYYALSDEGANVPNSIAKNFLEIAEGPLDGELKRLLQRDSRAAREALGRRRDEAKRYFEAVAPQWKELRTSAPWHASYMDSIIELIDPACTLLELGCGSGALLERIMPRPGQTLGVDYSQAMLDEARRSLGKNSGAVDLRLGYLEHLPLADSSVDLAVSYMVMHHIASPLEVLRDAQRVLRPGAGLAIVDLTRHNREDFREKYAHLWLGFDALEFENWLSQAGFTHISIKILGESGEAFVAKAVKRSRRGRRK